MQHYKNEDCSYFLIKVYILPESHFRLKLGGLLVRKWDSSKIIPAPQWLRLWSNDFMPREPRCGAPNTSLPHICVVPTTKCSGDNCCRRRFGAPTRALNNFPRLWLLSSLTLTNGWVSAEGNRNEELSCRNPYLTRNPSPLTNTSTKRDSQPSRTDWSSNSARERSSLESFTRRQSSRTDWSTTAGDAERRHWVTASRPGSESGFRGGGDDRSFSKIEITANFWRERWGARVRSRREE